jgi:hypothetical protein
MQIWIGIKTMPILNPGGKQSVMFRERKLFRWDKTHTLAGQCRLFVTSGTGLALPRCTNANFFPAFRH